jgi:glycosyltransferase involved in cell wall biosynthesis
MTSNILIQGIGCTETGARVVLKELLKAAPKEHRYWVICTTETAYDFIGRRSGQFADHIYVCGLSHKIFGRWLRLLLESFIAMVAILQVVDRVVNLSHYGLCLTGRFGLYVHSPLLMDFSSGTGWQEGRPNLIKRWLLHTCIRRARPFILQTEGMQLQLAQYCKIVKLPVPNNKIMRPKVEITVPVMMHRSFVFQLFYPTSRFAHKRAELAVAAGQLVHEQYADVGLVITIPAVSEDGGNQSGVKTLGRISREEVYEWFAGSDALLFTSERETLGLPLLEALEFGLPVIVPRLPYAVEILGDAGCYFEGDSPESVLAAIVDCRNNLDIWRAKIKARAQLVRRDAFTWTEHWDVLLKG